MALYDLSADFDGTETWVFDLDNTLYAPELRLFDQIEARMNAWLMRNLGLSAPEADSLRVDYWRKHGTTLAGLIEDFDVDPHGYLAEVHDIDFSVIPEDLTLAKRISRLKGRRIVFTNADTVYASRVIERRGLSGLFDAIYGINDCNFIPKPKAEAFAHLIALDGFDPRSAVMFEDDPRNLIEPAELGMQTVLVAPKPQPSPYIHYHTTELSPFLGALLGEDDVAEFFAEIRPATDGPAQP